MLQLPESGVYNKIFGTCLQGRFICSPHLFNHLFISAWACGYLFCALGYNPIPLYFAAQTVLSQAIGRRGGWCLY